MRAALVSLAGQPRDPRGEAVRVATKTIARRQLEFALAAGCERIFALGDGASPEAIALSHVAERAGARFQAIADSRGLLGAVRANDSLLVLAPGLLPDSPLALAWFETPVVLVAPADAVAAGFERIDLERAWGGALLLPGQLVERLSELPPDSDPAPALLRVALQARIKQVALPPSALVEGSWAMAGTNNLEALDRLWLARSLPPAGRWAMSQRAARAGIAAFNILRRANDRTPAMLKVAAAALLVVAAALALSGRPAAGFALLAISAFFATGLDVLGALLAAPFGTRRLAAGGWLAIATDVALVACGAGAIAGAWPDRLFAPLVLVGLLRAARWPSRGQAMALLGDRALLAAILSVAAAFAIAEPVIMLLALGLVGLKLADTG